MPVLRSFFARLAGLFAGPRRDRDLTDELESHLQLHIDDNLRRGMSPEEARREAVIFLGGVEQTKEAYRDRRSLPMIETLLQDLRYSARRLRKTPGFASLVILILALGIGANTAIFTVVEAVLLKPLSYPQPDRIVAASLSVKENPAVRALYGVADFLAAQADQTSFAAFAAVSPPGDSITYTGGREPLQIHGTMATADFFSVLGINPFLGRTFAPGEDRPGHDRVVLLSHAFWRQHFGADPQANSGLDAAPQPTLYKPYFEAGWTSWSREMFIVIRTNADPKVAASTLRSAVRGLDGNLPVTDIRTMNDLLSKSVAQPRFRTLLIGIFAAVALLLAVVGIFGVMSYLVGRRTQEIGVRMALGASRGNVLGMILGEGLRVVLIGVGLGLIEALLLGRLVKSLLFGVQPADPVTFLSAAVLLTLVALVACWIPARRAMRVDPMVALRHE
jgi:MacB-like periplasmic core domain/FtsX-like permease family